MSWKHELRERATEIRSEEKERRLGEPGYLSEGKDLLRDEDLLRDYEMPAREGNKRMPSDSSIKVGQDLGGSPLFADMDLDGEWQLGLEVGRPLGPVAYSRSRRSGIAHKPQSYFFDDYSGRTTQYTAWLNTLFPQVPAIPEKLPAIEHKRPWPAEARKLSESLLRNEPLARLAGGLRIETRFESYHPRRKTLAGRSDSLTLVSPRMWLVRSNGYGSQTTIQWCDDSHRGVSEHGLPTRPPTGVRAGRSAEPAAVAKRLRHRFDRTVVPTRNGRGQTTGQGPRVADPDARREPPDGDPRADRHGPGGDPLDRIAPRREGHLDDPFRPIRRDGRPLVGRTRADVRRGGSADVAADPDVHGIGTPIPSPSNAGRNWPPATRVWCSRSRCHG